MATKMLKSERQNPFPFEIIENAITKDEALKLKEFVVEKTKNSPTVEETEQSSLVEIYNRPDAWDEHGVIQKVQDLVREYVRETFYLIGTIEPRLFIAMKTDEGQGHQEVYFNGLAGPDVLYTGYVTLNDHSEFVGGDTHYTMSGEGIEPKVGDLIIHRNEEINNWKIDDVAVGARYDFVFVLAELARQIRPTYDEFEIEQSVDDGIPY